MGTFMLTRPSLTLKEQSKVKFHTNKRSNNKWDRDTFVKNANMGDQKQHSDQWLTYSQTVPNDNKAILKIW